MKKSFFLNGISVFILLFALILSGCKDGPQEVINREIYNPIPGIDKPEVAVTIASGGVLLTWFPVIEAGGYEVWRSGGVQIAAKNLTSNGRSAVQNKNGIFEFYDLVSLNNELLSDTEYTYTVIAVPLSPAKDIGKWEQNVTTGTIPEQGSQTASPLDVSLDIDLVNKSITVTVYPPEEGNIPDKYQITFENSSDTITKYISPDLLTSNSLTFTIKGIENAESTSDAYLVYKMLKNLNNAFYLTVIATLGDDYYFIPADTSIIERKYDPLFGSDAYLSFGTFSISSNAIYETGDSDTIIGFWNSIDLSQIKPKPYVTYTIERAILDTRRPYYRPIPLFSKSSGADTPVDSLTADNFGNLLPITVYDRELPASEDIYLYRIKGVKGEVTDYIESKSINIDFNNYLKGNVSLEIASKAEVNGGNDVYFKITPVYKCKKGLLRDDDKIVLYWLLGGNECYKTVPFNPDDKISFDKQDIEEKPAASQGLTFPKDPGAGKTGHRYLYVQAFLERQNGDRLKFDNIDSTHWSGGGLYSVGSAKPAIIVYNGQYIYRLGY